MQDRTSGRAEWGAHRGGGSVDVVNDHSGFVRRADGLSVPRRRFLATGAAGAGLLAAGSVLGACSSNGESVQEGVGNGPEFKLQPLFPRDVAYLAAGVPWRLPFSINDAEGVPLAEVKGPVTFNITFDGERVGDPVIVPVHDSGVPRPYLPLPFTFPRPGLYDIDIEYDGVKLNTQAQAVAADKVAQPLVGQPLPVAPTPTVTDSVGVDPICTLSPQCPFHEVDLRDALQGPLPVVLLLASPAYCQTTACGPILNILMDAAAGRTDMVVIHAEVYKDPKTAPDLASAQLAPLPSDFNMTFEPCLFVTNSAHELVARGDIVVDSVEMDQLLAMATA